MTEPSSKATVAAAQRLGCEIVRSERFLCHYEEFAAWAAGRRTTRLEDFYRWQRRRLGYLMDGDEPAGGRWNFDADNRRTPPRGERTWPRPPLAPLEDLDAAVLVELERPRPGGAGGALRTGCGRLRAATRCGCSTSS